MRFLCIEALFLFLPAGNTGYSLSRLLSITDPALRTRFLSHNMLDEFPESVPVYLSSPYKDDSFTYVDTSGSLSSDRTEEWYALYVSSDSADYNAYKTVLANAGWTFEVEYEKTGSTGNDDASLNTLYYKVFSGKEHYILVSFYENTGILEIWSGV